MRFALVGLLSLTVLLLAGCASVPAQVDKGPIDAKSFSFLPQKSGGSGGYTTERQDTHARIQDAITRNLTAKGLSKAAGRGDVEIGYLVVVANNATTASYDEYFGYGSQASALAEKAHKHLAKSQRRDYFEVGALVIDFTEPGTGRLLHRSYVHTELLKLPADQRDARLQQLVDACLGSVRFSN
jgi:hypothetical protein